jgi:hypothetical protein
MVFAISSIKSPEPESGDKSAQLLRAETKNTIPPLSMVDNDFAGPDGGCLDTLPCGGTFNGMNRASDKASLKLKPSKSSLK